MPFPYKLSDASNYIDYVKQNEKEVARAIVVEDQAVGIIGLTLQSDVYRLNAEIGFWLGEAYWGKGIMSKAVSEMSSLGFNTYKLHRIFAEVFDDNQGSMKVLINNHFVREAVLKQSAIKNDKIVDMHIFSCLKETWATHFTVADILYAG